MHRILGFVALLLVALPLPTLASPPMHFTRLASDSGLDSGGIMAIAQDAQGFLWFGTEDGLDRYDGYELRHYVHDRNGGLPSNWIAALAEDDSGTLWVGTDGGGLSGINLATGAFTSASARGGLPAIAAQEIIQVLHYDRRGRLWIGTRGGGLVMIDQSAGVAKRYRHSATDAMTPGSDSILAIIEDHTGALWIGGPGGVDRFDPASGRTERQAAVNAALAALAPGDLKVTALVEDHRGNLWIGSNAGLLRFDLATRAIRVYRSRADTAGSLPGDRIQALLEDSAQRLWVGTSSGLALYDTRADRFDGYSHEPTNPASLPDDDVISLFEDRTGLLWVGTKTGGVANWNSRSWSFGHRSGENDGFGDANPTGFAMDAAGTLWISTMGGGLHAVDRLHGTVTHYRHLSNDPYSLPDDRVMALLIDHEGALWVGTMSAGLSRLDPKSGRFLSYRHDPSDPGTLGAPGVMSLLEDSHKRIWAGTFGGGLSVLDRATGRFQRYLSDPTDPSTLSSNRATALAEDSSGRIWIGTDGGGLCLLDPVSGQVTRFEHSADHPQGLSASTVYAVHVDDRGRVWIGTRGGGLDEVVGSALIPTAIHFRTYGQPEGLPNSTIYGVEEDAGNRLWVSTNRGLARLDPVSGEVRNFRHSNGLQADEFNFGAHYRSAAGELFFGGPGGYNAFTPERLQFDEQAPPVVLTGVLTLNEPMHTATPYERLRRVDLGYRDRIVTFEFAALDFTSPNDNHYRYMLDGFDSGWVEAGSKHRVTYTNLDGGRYTFRVQAANSDGRWNEAGLTLPLVVQSPPWATTWARACYVIALLLLIFAVWNVQQKKLRREAQYAHRLEQDVRDRTAEVAQRNQELEAVISQLREASTTDPLTGLGNRRFLREAMPALMDAARASSGTDPTGRLAFLVIDLDHLKPVNDRHGHEAGDQVIIQMAAILRSCCRASDVIVRWGGDEFVVIYKGADAAAAEALAERIRARVAKQVFRLAGGKVARTSCSIGFTCYPFVSDAPELLTWEQTLGVADAALYLAKQQRNGWIGWTGTAAIVGLPSVLTAIERDAEGLERDGRLEVRRPRMRSDDTVDELLHSHLRQGDG